MTSVTYNLAELFESVVDVVPARTAMVTTERRLTYAELDERSNRLAHHLRAAGIGERDFVGLHLLNGTEYLEAMLAAFKVRAVPVNINYRYVERELEHLYSMMDLAALIVHRQYAPVAAAVAPKVSTLRHVIVVDDGTHEPIPDGWLAYETALAAAAPERHFTGRTSDDVYCACTGGTTGLPKGVLWRHEDIFFASMGGGDPSNLMGGPIKTPEELAERVSPDFGMVSLITPPFMHVSAHWGAFTSFFGGGTVVIPRPGSLDPAEICRLVVDEKVNLLIIVGDAMARPLMDHLAANPTDTSSLFAIGSGGAILSPATKRWMAELLPNVMVVDGFGSTETGVAGNTTVAGDGPPKFKMDDTTVVLDDEMNPVEPGSDTIGRLARRGHIPLGYYNDAEKTAATFVEKDGVRWVLPGDMASVADDGTIALHGRGSVSINTGGEKVFPEEVEAAIVGHPAIADVLVVGAPDERWGSRVAAVVAMKADETLTLAELQAYCRGSLAGYKIPRQLTIVPTVVRSPSGKADYRWAQEEARKAAEGSAKS